MYHKYLDGHDRPAVAKESGFLRCLHWVSKDIGLQVSVSKDSGNVSVIAAQECRLRQINQHFISHEQLQGNLFVQEHSRHKLVPLNQKGTECTEAHFKCCAKLELREAQKPTTTSISLWRQKNRAASSVHLCMCGFAPVLSFNMCTVEWLLFSIR